METFCETSDLLVFSHLRWDFVFQRPQHLMSRFAVYRRVFFFEEPLFTQTETPNLHTNLHASLHVRESAEGVHIVTPYLCENLEKNEYESTLAFLVDELIKNEDLQNYTLWYYTPMALPFSRHLQPIAILYDCMDELSNFKNSPPNMMELERELLLRSQLVFTGGHSLYNAKKHAHKNIHPMPSGINYSHFSQGRYKLTEPLDQASIPSPRLGFFGVIDERMDLSLLDKISKARPEWSFVIVGPVVKIDPESLPKNKNIYYLGMKDYKELPAYLAGWNCAIMPFVINDSTKFISPTKTPEYLAAGKPVVSTPIPDVICPYGEKHLVYIARSAYEFVAFAKEAMANQSDRWITEVDNFLAGISWDATWKRMAELEWRLANMNQIIHRKRENVSNFENSFIPGEQ